MKNSTGALIVALAAVAVMLVPSRDALGSGGGDDGWLLGGTAQLATDPENSANDVIRIRTDVAPFFGTVSRKVNVKVDRLDNMLEVKARFTTPKTCIGGSPRFQLAVDTDGDGTPNGNAFGYVGASPGFAACPSDTWLYEDLTGPGDVFITGGALLPSPPQAAPPNEELEWDLSQFGGPFYNSWSQVETFFTTMYPFHTVCTVALVDDTFGAPGMTGTAHYDLISGGRATWVDRSDIAGRGFAQGCGRPSHDDDDHDDDKDGDHDEDDDDDKFDRDRKERWGDD